MSNSELCALPENNPDSFNLLSPDKQERLLLWIKDNILPKKGFNLLHTSYSLKHYYNEYLTNGEFKGAMLKAGFEVYNKEQLNWSFNISKKSPVFANKLNP